MNNIRVKNPLGQNPINSKLCSSSGVIFFLFSIHFLSHWSGIVWWTFSLNLWWRVSNWALSNVNWILSINNINTLMIKQLLLPDWVRFLISTMCEQIVEEIISSWQKSYCNFYIYKNKWQPATRFRNLINMHIIK